MYFSGSWGMLGQMKMLHEPAGTDLARGGRRLLAWGLVLALWAPAASGQQIINGVRVHVSGIGAGAFEHGYGDTRFHLENLSTRHEARAVVELRQRYSHGGTSLRSVRRAVTVGPGSTVMMDLPLLPVQMGGTICVVTVGGRSEEITTSFIPNYQTWGGGIQGLASRTVPTQSLQDRLGAAGGGRHHMGGQAVISRAEWELHEWPAHWRSYSRFDVVIMSHAEWEGLTGPVRRAIRQYVEAGGFLLLSGVPAAELARHPVVAPEGLRMTAEGFGRVGFWPGGDMENVQGPALDMIRGTAQNTRTAMSGTAGRITGFQAKDDITVPIGGFFVLMLVFAVVVGPVNLAVVTRLNRRLLFLVTVPALSLTACGALLVYSLVSEGITPTVRTFGFTWLNQPQSEAVTLGVQAYYAPLAPAGGLRFGADVEIDPMAGRGHDAGGGSLTVDLTEGQHLASGWVRARIPTALRLRAHETRRERLDVIRTENGLEVVNGLGADIREAWVADDQGRVFVIRGLGTGQRGVLGTASGKATGSPMVLRDILDGGQWINQAGKFTANPAQHLQPRTYLARLDGAPFVERGLPGRAHLNEEQVVYGHYEEIRAAGSGS